MKAAILNKYNKNWSDLEIMDVSIPEVGNDDVLVKIIYAGVNPLDNMIIREEVKLITPYKLPLVMGNEFSGVVEEVGSNVSNFKKGDRVYARMPLDKIGAFAEYVSINNNALAHIPDYLDFDKAACVPLTALTAIQSFERVIALGVDTFFDYKTQDYSEILSDIDFVMDTLGEKELEKEFKILKTGGSLVSLKGLPNKEFAERMGFSFVKKTLFGFAGKKFDKLAAKKNQKYYFLFVESNGNQLEKVSEIFEQNKVEVSIDGVYELNDINEALKKVDSGGSKGKTLIKIGTVN